MADIPYGIVKQVEGLSFDEAIEKVTAALQAQGFGILTEIDVAATLKKKLDVEHYPYRILGACNPHIAHRALQEEQHLGLLLPCNVVVQDHPEQGVVVSALDPQAMGGATGNPALQPMMDEAGAKIRAALDAL